jgi:uncharacterized SAM-binding protein YcdF (DUF218 family)
MANVTASWRRLDSAATTQEEATRIQEAATRFGWRSILVVTSPIHTRRACATVERLTRLAVTCVAAYERAPATRAPTDAPNRLESARQYMYERLATWKYRRKGWM